MSTVLSKTLVAEASALRTAPGATAGAGMAWQAVAIIFIAACAGSTCANAQKPSEIGAATAITLAANAACPEPQDVLAEALIGRWQAAFADGGPEEILELGPHPDYPGSLRGTLARGTARALLAGDIEEGDLLLEESANGTTITATWTGQVADRSCGQRIEGTWNDALTSASRTFTLLRAAPAAAPQPPAPSPARQP